MTPTNNVSNNKQWIDNKPDLIPLKQALHLQSCRMIWKMTTKLEAVYLTY